jgi:type IX secretion system PorP/SprF family membrane protein
MPKKPVILLAILLSMAIRAGAQGINAGPLYQSLLMNNPAMSGFEPDGVLRLSYLNYYPGNHLDLNSMYLSYDSYISALHGGAAFYLSEDYLGGIVNDLRGGFSYAYFLQAGKDLFIHAGLTASVFHRGFNFSNAILPDQIDPIGGITMPSSESLGNKGKTLLDVGAGIVVTSGSYSGGFAVNHIAEPELYSSPVSTERIRRRYTFHMTAAYNLDSKKELKIEPLLIAVRQGDYFTAGAGTSVESTHLAISAVLYGDNGKNLNIQAGFSFRFSIVSVYYNYLFNLASGNSLLPLSLQQQAGLAFSLYNVEKRNDTKTIYFPKL